jgi:hypothetical protein
MLLDVAFIAGAWSHDLLTLMYVSMCGTQPLWLARSGIARMLWSTMAVLERVSKGRVSEGMKEQMQSARAASAKGR